MSNSLWPHGLYNPRNFPGQNTGVGSLSLLQGIFPTQGLDPGLLHCRQILYHLSYQGSPFRGIGSLKGWALITGIYTSPPTHQHITKGLFTLIPFTWFVMLICQEKITGILKLKTHSWKRQQISKLCNMAHVSYCRCGGMLELSGWDKAMKC